MQIKLAECRRVVLFEYSEEFGTIDVRHYLITLAPQGISKGVKKMLKRKPNQSLPDLSKYQDISEFLEKSRTFPSLSFLFFSFLLLNYFLKRHPTNKQRNSQSGYTESDAEDDPDSKVRIIDEKHIKHQISQQSAIRLKEIGPRMQLRLASISDGFCSGEIIFTSARNFLIIRSFLLLVATNLLFLFFLGGSQINLCMERKERKRLLKVSRYKNRFTKETVPKS